MDELKEEITDQVRSMIAGGFYDDEEIQENIMDLFYDEVLDEAWLKEEISRQYTARLKEQAAWPQETDFDRLARVFDQLNSSGIIALHNAGYTRQDGESDCGHIYSELKAEGISTRGFCFYHAQDLERVIEGDELYLAFGSFEADSAAVAAIGEEIIKALAAHGFENKWDHTADTRIAVPDIKWLKRFGSENCSEDRAVELLSNGSIE